MDILAQAQITKISLMLNIKQIWVELDSGWLYRIPLHCSFDETEKQYQTEFSAVFDALFDALGDLLRLN